MHIYRMLIMLMKHFQVSLPLPETAQPTYARCQAPKLQILQKRQNKHGKHCCPSAIGTQQHPQSSPNLIAYSPSAAFFFILPLPSLISPLTICNYTIYIYTSMPCNIHMLLLEHIAILRHKLVSGILGIQP